jgi:sugar phosphate isomerase/epimerase
VLEKAVRLERELVQRIDKRELHYLFVPSHTIWLPSNDDVKARIAISRSYLRSTASSSIGFEALQKKNSLSMSVFNSQVSTALAIRKELGNEGVETQFSVHAPYTPIQRFSLASESPMIRRRTIDAVEKCAELAEEIGAPVVNTHLGGITKTINKRSFSDPAVKKATLDRIKDALTNLVSRVEGRDVVLAIENVPYPLEETPPYSPVVGIFPRDFSEILKDVDSKTIAVTVDFCHLWITYKTLKEFVAVRSSRSSFVGVSTDDYPGLTAYESSSIDSYARDPFGSYLKLLRQMVVHVHVADSGGLYVPSRSIVTEGNVLGEGDLDLDSFVRALRQIEQYSSKKERMMIVLETREVDFNEPMNSLRSLMKLDELLRTGIAT